MGADCREEVAAVVKIKANLAHVRPRMDALWTHFPKRKRASCSREKEEILEEEKKRFPDTRLHHVAPGWAADSLRFRVP